MVVRDRRLKWSLAHALLCWVLMAGTPATAAVYRGDPTNYTQLVAKLTPGDVLTLGPGVYRRNLRILDLHGEPGRPITIQGGHSDRRPVFHSNAGVDTVDIGNSSFLVIRNLEIDGRGKLVNAVRASARYTHHITLENLHIHNFGRHQQMVGISTKSPAWDWVIRGNVIEGIGTGMYLGNSDGRAPFFGGLIEDNRVVNTIGYNLQIKHQQPRRRIIPEMPTTPRTTVIRRNVFVKAEGGSTGPEARPNVLVGHFPLEGPGEDDRYLIYGNLFFENPNEALFQGEGNIALYNNLFFNSSRNEFSAIAIQPHNDIPRKVRVFFNTVVHPWKGIRILRKEDDWVDDQQIVGNAVFAETPLQGGERLDNVVADYAKANKYLRNPVAGLGGLDLRPRQGRLRGSAIDLTQFREVPEYDRDFNGNQRSGRFRGAWNPGWKPGPE